MFASFSIIEFIIPWIWLILSAILYYKRKTKSTIFILISLLLLASSDLISYHIQVFFIGSRTEGEVQDLIYFFLILGKALHVLGSLLLTAGVIWFVRSELEFEGDNT